MFIEIYISVRGLYTRKCHLIVKDFCVKRRNHFKEFTTYFIFFDPILMESISFAFHYFRRIYNMLLTQVQAFFYVHIFQ